MSYYPKIDTNPVAHDSEIEQALLGLIMARNDFMRDIKKLIKADYFYFPLHQNIFHFLDQTISQHGATSPESLLKYLTNDVDFLHAGGKKYIISLLDAFMVGTLHAAKDYARQVKELYLLRSLQSITATPTQTDDSDQLIKSMLKNLKALSDEAKSDPIQGLHYTKATDIHASLDVNDFVQGLLSDSGFSVVYGPSNCGKTFFMTDLALHVASGAFWRNRRVERGGVIYAALEGPHGLKNRIAAFRQHYGTVPDNFAMVPSQVNMLDPHGNISDFIKLLNEAKEDLGSVKLVVIDTLARAIAGGDENTPQDMGMLVHHADRIRAETGAHVCFIHHSGKDALKGARGHSSLRAAVDTEIEITRDDGAQFSTVTIVKQRDMAMGDPMQFSLQIVPLGMNVHEETVTSCVVVPVEMTPKPKQERLSSIQEFIYETILYAVDTYGVQTDLGRIYGTQKVITYDQFRESLEFRGFKDLYHKDGTDEKVKSSTQAARISLKSAKKINFNKLHIWLINITN